VFRQEKPIWLNIIHIKVNLRDAFICERMNRFSTSSQDNKLKQRTKGKKKKKRKKGNATQQDKKQKKKKKKETTKQRSKTVKTKHFNRFDLSDFRNGQN
jgi:hypothetical protein